MSTLLKSVGQGLGGLGLLIGAIAYWAKVQAAGQEQRGELMGLLTSVVTEISVNEDILDRLVKEPHNLITPAEGVLETGSWDRHGVRTARLLGDYGVFSPIALYYEYILRFQEGARHGAATSEDIERLRGKAETCMQQGVLVRGQILRYLSSIVEIAVGK